MNNKKVGWKIETTPEGLVAVHTINTSSGPTETKRLTEMELEKHLDESSAKGLRFSPFHYELLEGLSLLRIYSRKQARDFGIDDLPRYFRHYKGNFYQALGVAHHSDTGERMVVYRACYKNEKSQNWVRPLAAFTSKVLHEGVLQPRFRLATGNELKNLQLRKQDHRTDQGWIIADDLVRREGKHLIGRTVHTEPFGEWPGGLAVVTEIEPDPAAPEIAFQVKSEAHGKMGVFDFEYVKIIL